MEDAPSIKEHKARLASDPEFAKWYAEQMAKNARSDARMAAKKKEVVKGFLDVLKEPKAEKTKVTKPKKTSSLGKWLTKNPVLAAGGLAGAGYVGYKMFNDKK